MINEIPRLLANLSHTAASITENWDLHFHAIENRNFLPASLNSEWQAGEIVNLSNAVHEARSRIHKHREQSSQ